MVSTQSSSAAEPPTYPVLISGAGPIGLYLALELAKLNVPVRIIDRSKTICPLSKSINLQPRSLEILGMTDPQLLDTFLKNGLKTDRLHFWRGTSHIGALPVIFGNETPFRFFLTQEQNRTSEIFMKELNGLGVFVEYDWELTDCKVVEAMGESYVETTIRKPRKAIKEHLSEINDDDDTLITDFKIVDQVSPTVRENAQEYETQIIRSRYLIGSDGGRSTVRHLLNIPFDGCTLRHKTFMFDGTVETDMPIMGTSSIIDGVNNVPMEYFTLSERKVRVAVDGGDIEPDEDIAQTVKELTPKKIEEMIRDIVAPFSFHFHEASWITCFKINERRAKTFVHKNRIFLVGDAAHVHSPSGGLGLNTGLQDAHNLAWKLAFVYHGLSQESLLETYREREPIADLSIRISGAIVRANRCTDTLKYTYPQNSLNISHATQKEPNIEAAVGARAANAPLRAISLSDSQQKDSGTRESLHLFDLFVGLGQFSIIVFTGTILTSRLKKRDTSTPASRLDSTIQLRLTAWRARWNYTSVPKDRAMPEHLLRLHVVAAATAPTYLDKSVEAFSARANGNGEVYLDESSLAHNRYELDAKDGPTSGGIVVVRPDAHIGYRVQGTGESAWDDVERYLESILIPIDG
ncbi:hypothetical protein BGW38_006827 [Lunasporangiospora selenospora]|uniref:FAD-binding domain-containing protein n=1 Tax=Lunasporangiospora selenospora TaxID=979761 RepID=A0A9P6KH14_9FUNG|nr:hypothetical protein BGW38_006827 [Lunasporangiospora selenospora]